MLANAFLTYKFIFFSHIALTLFTRLQRKKIIGAGRSAASVQRPSPRPVNHAPAESGNRGSLFGTVAEGMAFGAGSGVAHRAVDSMFGPRTIQHETTWPPRATLAPIANSLGSDACNVHSKAFHDCLNSYGNEINKCQFYMDMLAECRRNSGATLSA
ncbi:hypothetical protein VNO78_03626 [Psophocarpus tetragonolobus]|uniref:CHCH domain-containing protein n=1 Tax=Psophocarpus tetragonolobus TaxID=3891 RepID=A0AAN9T0V7_PSOTE